MKQKKGILLMAALLALILVVLLTQNAYAYLYQVSYDCPGDACVLGQKVTYTINISNNGVKKLQFNKVILKTLDNLNLSVYDATIDSRKQPIIIVQPSKKIMVTLGGTVPRESQGILHFQVCFNRLINNEEHNYLFEGIKELMFCENDNHTLPFVMCLNNNHCGPDEECVEKSCKKLSCGDCEYATFHRCYNYSCCSPEQCSASATCLNHTCSPLQCNETQQYVSHSCTMADCPAGFILQDHTCVDMGCKDDEYVINDSCSKLSCNEREQIMNHSCYPLECLNDQGYQNHQCVDLICQVNETMVDHQCTALPCNVFQDARDQQCHYNKEYIIRSLAEVVFLALIIALLFMDIYKYEKQHKVTKKKEEKN